MKQVPLGAWAFTQEGPSHLCPSKSCYCENVYCTMTVSRPLRSWLTPRHPERLSAPRRLTLFRELVTRGKTAAQGHQKSKEPGQSSARCNTAFRSSLPTNSLIKVLSSPFSAVLTESGCKQKCPLGGFGRVLSGHAATGIWSKRQVGISISACSALSPTLLALQ